MYLDTAAEMWIVLNNRYNQGNGPRIFELNESLLYLHQGDESVSAYFTKLTTIWDEINQLRPRIPCVCAAAAQNQDHINHDQVLQFLKGLHESYHAIRDQILLIDPCQSLNKVNSMVIHQERQRTLGNCNIPPIAAAAATTSTLSIDPAANQTSKNKRPRPHCTHCQKPGHYKDKCYFLHGFLPGYGKPRTSDSTNQIHKKQDSGSTSRPQTHQVSTTDSQLTQAQCQQLISMLTQQLQPTTDASTSDQPAVNNITGNIDPLSPTSWILDSCATYHVCCHITCFSSITNMLTNKHVTLPNGTSVNIEKSGTIILNSNITLYNVLYVPARTVHRSV
ncbi:uncharacterized protein LOC133034264 [Cannabis sativa]|uniref:uncharacterized protein LOC133034264 n=1 Tax=Cannabis sativa TaxID=3483 RepID=UPI0029CA2AEF|nr:uncharacterized protein LOC133034264 [Cannabis sativa]